MSNEVDYMMMLCYKCKFMQCTVVHLVNLHNHLLFGPTQLFVQQCIIITKQLALTLGHLRRLWFKLNVRFHSIKPFYDAVNSVCFEIHSVIAALQNISVFQEQVSLSIQPHVTEFYQRLYKKAKATVEPYQNIVKQVPREVHLQAFQQRLEQRSPQLQQRSPQLQQRSAPPSSVTGSSSEARPFIVAECSSSSETPSEAPSNIVNPPDPPFLDSAESDKETTPVISSFATLKRCMQDDSEIFERNNKQKLA
jgi:hypothetical protein